YFFLTLEEIRRSNNVMTGVLLAQDIYPNTLLPRALAGMFKGTGKKWSITFYRLLTGSNLASQHELLSLSLVKHGLLMLVYRCLMQSIVNSPRYNNVNTTCDQLETFAFESHPRCYIENGFCTDILLSDQCQNLVCIGNEIFTDRDFYSKQAIDQMTRTAASCSSRISTFLLDARECSLNSPDHALVAAIRNYLDCNERAFDFIIMLDSSGSITSTNFERMTNFVANILLSNFTIGPNDTRVGVICFASSPSIVIPLGSINTYSQLATAVRDISYTSGGTNTAAALDLLSTAFATARVSEGIPRVAAVFTDGMSNNAAATVQSAQAVHDDGITVFSFGIGTGVSNAELIAIASDGQQGVFTISGFSSNTFQAVLIQLRVSTCASSTESETGKEIATTLPKGSSRLLVYVFPSMGMTLKIDITVGNLVVRGSFTVQNPDVLTQDFSVMSNGNDIDYFISPELYIQSTTDDDDDGSRRRRQTSMPNVYLSIAGLNDINSFALNTTFGDTTSPRPDCSGICKLKLLRMTCEERFRRDDLNFGVIRSSHYLLTAALIKMIG
uniref:VWFA domain-containing protein n=1 Tax=Amphimedon queenslandica TaxID=400682 RepID=A0A1X7VAX4_AMPQE